MAAQRFLNNFDWSFIGPVTAATHVGFESAIGRGILQISDAASALLTTLTGGDWYVLTAYKRSGSVESAIEILKVLGVNEVAYAAPGECRIRVERGHEGSALQTYVAGDLISMRITAGGLNDLASDAELATHTGNTSNPHAVTKAQVGLSNVDNVSGINAVVSTLQAAADTAALNSAKAYADGLVVGLWDDRGAYNASVNTFPAAGGSGTAGAVLKGDIWTVSVAGTLGGVAVAIGDSVRAVIDTPGQTAANWAITSVGLGYVPENSANKDASGGYPSLIGQALKIWNAAKTFYTSLSSTSTANRAIALPDKDGTVALTDDITGGTRAGSFTTINATATTNILSNTAGALTVTGGNRTVVGSLSNAAITSNTAQAADLGGSLGFRGIYTGTLASQFASISGRKENGTDGDYAGYLVLATTPNGGSTTERLRIGSNGDVTVSSAALLGYGVGAGATVTQATSKATTVTLNKPSGVITTHAASLAAGAVVYFQFNNSLLSALDGLTLNTTVSGELGWYNIWHGNGGAGYTVIAIKNISASPLAEAIQIGFSVTKRATS